MGEVARCRLDSVGRMAIFSGEEFNLIITSGRVKAGGPAIDCRPHQQDNVLHCREM